MKMKLINFVQECFRIQRILNMENKTFIILIPKTNQANGFNQCRPISLCNFSNKVVENFFGNKT